MSNNPVFLYKREWRCVFFENLLFLFFVRFYVIGTERSTTNFSRIIFCRLITFNIELLFQIPFYRTRNSQNNR